MSFGNTTETDILNLLFQKTLASYLGTLATTGNTNLYLSLHTSDPGEAGSQTSNETAYTNYARQAVVRTSGGWTISGNQVKNTVLVQFPQCGASGATITHVAIGTDVSGTGQIIASGALSSPITVANLIQPQFSAEALVLEID